MLDLVIAVEGKYTNPNREDWYEAQIAKEDDLLLSACKKHGISAKLVAWDDNNFDWSSTKTVLIREVWDYFHRFKEFEQWLELVSSKTRLINDAAIIKWNWDKHYMADVEKNGVAIVPTIFIEVGDQRSLSEIISSSGWDECILKPCISGGARHTYKLNASTCSEYEKIQAELIQEEPMMLQPFIESIGTKGEVSFIVINGKYEHAVLKKAKAGDFRVQDDWGGTLHEYQISAKEIRLAEAIVAKSCPEAYYARVDLVWGSNDELLLGELELIEPELWFRRNEKAAENLIIGIKETIS